MSASPTHHTLGVIAPETTFEIRVHPRAKRNAVVRQPDGTLKVFVTAPPEAGRANTAVIDTVADWLDVKRRQVQLVTGQTSRTKVIRVVQLLSTRSP